MPRSGQNRSRIVTSNINTNSTNNQPSTTSVRTSNTRSNIRTANVVGGTVGSGSGLSPSQVLFTQPQFYSPIHTPVNWQIPSKRREVYIWNRFFAQMEPKIAASLRFYSQFPFSGFNNVINDPIRAEHFEALRKRLNLDYWLPLIAYEYFAMGDVFPFISFFCEKCGGSNMLKNGDSCSHEGGTISMLSVLNPDWIDVKMNPIDPSNPTISLVPDDTLKQIVWSKNPPEIYNALPMAMKALILANKPIPLSKRSVTHLKHDEIPYQPYGRSILASLFPTLAYQDKLKQAQWIVAERHILPIKVVKVGNDQRPAGAGDIADVQSQLAMTANDPNLTLVTHHAFSFEWIGACHVEDTEVMTKRGFLKYYEVNENDEIATLNPETKILEYKKYNNKYIYDYDSDLNGNIKKFKGKHYDVEVTKNHKMYSKIRIWDNFKNKYSWNDFELIDADKIIENSKFLNSLDWIGQIPNELPYKKYKYISNLNLDDYLKFIGFFLSEGSYISQNNKIYGITLTQNTDSHIYHEMVRIAKNIKKPYINIDNRYKYNIKYKKECAQICLGSKVLGEYFNNNFGVGCANKKIDKWILDLPKDKLEIILQAMMDGDGNITIKNGKKKYRYTTTSKILADQTQEIVLKLGYNPKISVETYNNHYKTRYDIYWSEDSFNSERSVKDRNISEISYKGKVWCLSVPNGIFVTRLNGKIGIHGNSGKVLQLTKEWDLIDKAIIQGLGVNEALLSGSGPSYSQAAIGIEATIRRLEIVRGLIATWIEEKIYKEEARMQCFYKENQRGEKILDYPTIKWKDLNLRDETQKNQMFLQLWDKGIVSTQFICETLGIDYEVETEKVRLEQQFQQQFGIAPKQRGPGGKGPGGKGPGAPLGGGFGGGPKGGGMGGDPNKGNLPGGQSGPGLPGDSIAPSMSGGESAGPMASLDSRIIVSNVENGAVQHSQSYELARELSPKVSKPGKFRIKDKDLLHQMDEKRYMGLVNGEPIEEPEIYEGPRTGLYRPTNIEGILYSSIARAQEQGNLPDDFIYQQNPEPDRMPRITCDGIFPSIRLIIEADGKQFHSSQEDIEKNQRRDDELRSYGWTVLRYTEDQLKHKSEDCLKNIIETAQGLMAQRDQTHPE